MAKKMKSLGPLHIMEIKSNQKIMAAREQVGQKLQNGTIADQFGANVNASSTPLPLLAHCEIFISHGTKKIIEATFLGNSLILTNKVLNKMER